MRNYLLTILMLLIGFQACCQTLLTGTVSDSTTAEVIPLVNVYIDRTTIGTTTDDDGRFVLVIPRGHSEVVFSFVGYRSHTLRISPSMADTARYDVKLAAAASRLDAVTIDGKADVEWRRLVKTFESAFLGENRTGGVCKILNPEYIDLERVRRNGQRVVMAAASQPIEVDNYALGYKVYYDLHHFAASSSSVRFEGNVFFVAMTPQHDEQAAYWHRNREHVYLGSQRHFFKAVLDGSHTAEGFDLTGRMC